jgi:hypothetical protein
MERSDADARDRFHRTWRDAHGAEWRAQVDRIALNCGACDLTRYLHVYAPTGERWTFTLAPDASLEGVSDVALQRMVEERSQ